MNRFTSQCFFHKNFPSTFSLSGVSFRHWINKHEYNNLIIFLTSPRQEREILFKNLLFDLKISFVSLDSNIWLQFSAVFKFLWRGVSSSRNRCCFCVASGDAWTLNVLKIFKFDYSLQLQLGDLSNPELRMLTDQLEKIRFGGDEYPVKRISVRSLLPDTEHYMTYEGSTTSPACHETVSFKKTFFCQHFIILTLMQVTWIVLNKPIYITKQQVSLENDIKP